MELDYDPAKNTTNIEKHGLRFQDVALLDWPNAKIRVDNRKAYGEVRQTALAEGPDGLCHVTYTIRDNVMRVISFRRAHERERKYYD